MAIITGDGNTRAMSERGISFANIMCFMAAAREAGTLIDNGGYCSSEFGGGTSWKLVVPKTAQLASWPKGHRNAPSSFVITAVELGQGSRYPHDFILQEVKHAPHKAKAIRKALCSMRIGKTAARGGPGA
ncbi:MAG: hypothetical protein GC131_09425 [Alphaproteobacteria bacterium]|nr:hypothetical protein [Alphaproteobacteria bacterium]